MPLEIATYVAQLVPTNPPGTDPKSQGDDHLRLLKSALQATFPGFNGAFQRVQSKPTGFTPAMNDNSSLFDVTAGSAVSLLGVATYGNGWCVGIRANGTAVVVTPNPPETVNGLASLTIPAGQVAYLWSDGSQFYAAFMPSTAAWTSTNDGAGSGLDADLLDGQEGAYYRNASNINAGTLDAARLPASGATPATYGSATQVAQVTVDVAGRVTSAVDVAIQIAESQVTGLVSDLAGKQPLDATLTTLAGITTGADLFIYFTGVDSATTATLTAFARTLLDDATQAAARATLGLTPGTDVQAQDATLQALAGANWAANAIPIGSGADTVSQVSFAANTFPGRSSTGNLVAKTITDQAFSLLDDATASDMRTTLGLVIGTNVQAQDAELSALAGLASAADQLPYFTGSGTAALTTLSSFMRTVLDDTTAAAAAATLSVLPLSGGTLTGFLTLHANPTSDLHAATKQYVDSIGSGISVKDPCRVASTANINLSAPGSTIDGETMNASDRFLAKDQTAAEQNGIYVWNGAATPATRATDADSAAEILGALTFITAGSTNVGRQYFMNTPSPITLDTTALTWVLYYQPASYLAGNGLTLSGLTFNVGTASSARIVVNADNIDLATTAVTPNPYGSATQVGTFTVDAYGRLTAAGNTSIQIAESQVTNLVSDLAAKQPLDATLTALAGLTIADDSLSIGTGVDAFTQVTFGANTFPGKSSTGSLVAKAITDFGFSLLDDANASTARGTLGAAASGANTDLTSVYLNNTGLKLRDTDASHGLIIAPGSNLTADRTLTVTTGDASRTVTLSGNLTVSSTATISGTNTGDQTITLTGDVTGSGTGSFAATIANNAVTNAKAADMATNTIKARVTTGTGDPEDVAIAANQFLARSSTGQLAAKSITDAAFSLLDDADAATMRTTLGVAIGTNVQAFDATLTSIAALGTAGDKMLYTTAADTWAETNLSAFIRGLLDDVDATAARSTLGLVIGTNVQAYDANTAKLNVVQSWTKAQGSTSVALTDATTIAVDASLSNVFHVTLGGNRTLGQPTNPTDGQTVTIFITQDATGNRTLAYHADWLFSGGTDPVLSTAANRVDVLTAIYRSSTTKWYAQLTKAYL